MPPLDSDMVLRAEANAIHRDQPEIPKDIAGKALYRALHERNSSALCLSGGGIRSASFALGVIEALAVHPRQASAPQEGDKQAASAEKSLLSQFNYLSTVSGGGYIGSWLSALISRIGYEAVWSKLVGRREHPEDEPSEIAWLRAYSNYLTPKLGLFSADTWSAIGLFIRNLVLNWLVILPALCLVLLLIKGLAAVLFWLTGGALYVRIALAALAAALMIWVLRFVLRNRPSCNVSAPGEHDQAATQAAAQGGGSRYGDPHRDETAHIKPGANERKFLKACLAPALVAALLFALYLMTRHDALATWRLWSTALLAFLVGATIYMIAWFVAAPPWTCRPAHGETRGKIYWTRELFSWCISGGVYGAFIAIGAHLFATMDLGILIANFPVPVETERFLIVLIYGVPWIITAQLTAEMIFVGLTNWERYSDPDREWFGRSTGWFTLTAIAWVVVAFLVIVGADLARWLITNYDSAKYGSGIVAIASALFSAIAGKSSKSGAAGKDEASGLLMRVFLPVAAVLFLLLLILTVSALLDYLLFEHGLLASPLVGAGSPADLTADTQWLVAGILIVVFIALVSWTHVNINRFSMHALYRNRLIRGYLGASNPERAPNPFTGFDERDNIRMRSLWPPAVRQWRPFHVVNVALNVVNSGRLAWQERKATSFTVTPLHCGTAADDLGYRATPEYGDAKRGGISLGTALAISGAAASPNMGYHSSPLVTLLLALFNVRLGWWLGNPGLPGEETYRRDGPRVAIKPFIAEMFGQTTDTARYVYLSDGGHFENLGLYEMIRRRCRCIVVSDAGCDPNFGFGDLGNAARKIAIDLGVYISFSELRELKARSKDNSIIQGSYYAIGEIDYKTAPEGNPGTENGYILYVKPGYHGNEGAGIVAYATANATFPHETTGDQFFSESQFESYRTLGFEITDSVLKQAAKNVQTIANAGKAQLSAGKLCDLVRALEPGIIKDAEDVYASAQIKTPSEAIKSLSEGDLKVLRGIFNPSKDNAARGEG